MNTCDEGFFKESPPLYARRAGDNILFYEGGKPEIRKGFWPTCNFRMPIWMWETARAYVRIELWEDEPVHIPMVGRQSAFDSPWFGTAGSCE